MFGECFSRYLVRKHLVIVLALVVAQVHYGQVILYQETFGGAGQAPWLSSAWSANTPQVMTDPNTPSGGYPGASGGINLMARNCMPEWEERIFEVSGISTLGYTGIRVGFGHRRTSCFVPPVILEWSPDAINWELIEDYLSPVQAGIWTWAGYFELPPEAENKEEIFLRWRYWTEDLAGCSFHCNAFAGNYRIDDLVVEASVPLPVEWLHFEVRNAGSDALLHWATASESGNDFFEIQRSEDGHVFQGVGRVSGKGNSLVRNDYEFVDSPGRSGIYYYRLRQVDWDGNQDFSPLRVLQLGMGTGQPWIVRHEPGHLEVYLQRPTGFSGDGLLTWWDAQGRFLGQSIILVADPAGQHFPLPVSPAGMLFLHIRSGTGQQVVAIIHP